MNLQEIEQEYLEELQEEKEDDMEEAAEDQFLKQQELMKEYGAPEPEEKMNPSSFLFKAAFSPEIDVVRTTFLSEGELGRPLFTMRFMMKMEDIAKYYLDPICKELKIPNRIAQYFRADINNIAESGMSNKGFIPNLSVTRRMDATKRRVKSNLNLKGGEVKQNEN